MIDYIEFKSPNIAEHPNGIAEHPNEVREAKILKNIYRAFIPLRIRKTLRLSRFFQR
jgi:hypothetical protein